MHSSSQNGSRTLRIPDTYNSNPNTHINIVQLNKIHIRF